MKVGSNFTFKIKLIKEEQKEKKKIVNTDRNEQINNNRFKFKWKPSNGAFEKVKYVYDFDQQKSIS